MINTIVDVICCIALAVAAVANIWAYLSLKDYRDFLEREIKKEKEQRK